MVKFAGWVSMSKIFLQFDVPVDTQQLPLFIKYFQNFPTSFADWLYYDLI